MDQVPAAAAEFWTFEDIKTVFQTGLLSDNTQVVSRTPKAS